MSEKVMDVRFSPKLGDDGLPIATVSEPRVGILEKVKARLLRAREEHRRSEADIVHEAQIVAAFDSLKNGLDIAGENYARLEKDTLDAASRDVISQVTWQGAHGLVPLQWRNRVVQDLLWQDCLVKNQERILAAIREHTIGAAYRELDQFIAENKPVLERLKLV